MSTANAKAKWFAIELSYSHKSRYGDESRQSPEDKRVGPTRIEKPHI